MQIANCTHKDIVRVYKSVKFEQRTYKNYDILWNTEI